ncbi:hypothetical protein M0Q03_03975, partial [bacterium]|nr:hypothetical protein [bacterium]
MEEKTKIFWNNFMVKADRVFAWILLFVIILYAITGYGMTKGLIDSNIAHSLHLQILGIVGLTAFVIHTSWGIHLALKRWNLWNVFMKIVLVLFYTGLISGLLYVHFFYKGVEKERPNFPVNEQSSNISGNSSAINANDNNNTKTTVFTAET